MTEACTTRGQNWHHHSSRDAQLTRSYYGLVSAWPHGRQALLEHSLPAMEPSQDQAIVWPGDRGQPWFSSTKWTRRRLGGFLKLDTCPGVGDGHT